MRANQSVPSNFRSKDWTSDEDDFSPWVRLACLWPNTLPTSPRTQARSTLAVGSDEQMFGVKEQILGRHQSN
jgi:hypothetical protein